MEMSPQQQHESLNRSRTETKTSTHYENKRRMKSQSHRRQSAPSLVISKALTRSRTVSRDSVLVPVFPKTLPLVQSFLGPERAFLLHGHAQLKTGLQTQDRHLFLFTDLLIIAKSKSPTNFKLKTQACVCEMWTAGCMEEVCEGSTNPDWSFVMGWPTYNCVATFSSTNQKERWLSLLKSRIKEEKEKNDPKTIPLKVLGKDIGSLIPTKIIAVSNSDSTNEVVRLALQQFGIAGCVKDYQLWVSSKRENAPYPLIGHECPFSIHMSHVREPLSQSGGGRDTVTPPDRQRAPHPEHLLLDKECQFILKPRRITATQQPAIDPSQKAFRRRRSLVNWAFWRGSTSQLHDLSFSSPATGCLFGQPLSAVCRNVALPKPIMDMLVFLYHEGAFTRGIFRRSAGAKACRELRDTLDAGAREIPLIREHIFIIAGVFKDFLRNIPGSLLCSDLYEQWIDVMEEVEDEETEQARAIQRLIGQLPIEHSFLLRYVVAMLHGIQGNAHDNQMNAFNLSVCIAPSMLWAPGPSSPEVEGEGAKKVCDLVCFMIEHCQEVLGDDVTSLFGGPPLWGRFSEQGSDASSFHLTDSSYDSLENELNEDSGESPGLHARRGHRRVKPRQRSLDSVLTLSDYEPDRPDGDADRDVERTPDAQPGNPNHHHHLRLSPSARPRSMRLLPAEAGPSAQDRGPTPSPDPLSMGGPRRQRRSSEPVMSRGGLSRSGGARELMGSIEALSDEDDDEEEDVYPGALRVHAQTRASRGGACEGSGSRSGQSLLHAASYSSLSSTPPRSSVDSLDSLLSHPSDHPAKRPHSSAAPLHSTSGPPVIPVSTPAPGPAKGPRLKSSPPKEGLSWGALKCGRGLHPSTWLKRARRMSLQKQEEGEKKSGTLLDQERGGRVRQTSVDLPRSSLAGSSSKGRGPERGRVTQDPGAQPPKQDSESLPSQRHSVGQIHDCRSPCYQPSDKPLTVRELREVHSHACLQHQYGNTGSDVINKGQATGSDAIDKGQAAGSDAIDKGQAAGSDAIDKGQAAGSDAIDKGQAAGSDAIDKGQAAGSDAIEKGQAAGSDGGESKCLPQGVSLDRQKSHSLTSAMQGSQGGRLFQRRASAPGAPCLDEALGLNRASTLHLERLNREAKLGQKSKGDPGLKVSEVEPQGSRAERSSEPRFCLSPSSTKVVRDYFSSHRRGNPQSGQQVAHALVQEKRHWLRRCSDPMLEPDFDQLLFAEESYV